MPSSSFTPNDHLLQHGGEIRKELTEAPEDLANRLLDMDPSVIGCYIIRVPDGAVLADRIKDPFRAKIAPFAHAGAGMASKWGLAGLSASKRMDDERGRTKYLVAARVAFSTLLFLHPKNENMEIGIMLKPEVEPSKIYERVMKELS